MNAMEWARSAKAEFVTLQIQTDIPALFAAAQHCHEGFNANGAMSELLAEHSNGCGLKWAEWEAEFGCSPVAYLTTEYIGGKYVQVTDDFCHCPDWQTWLKVYTSLLTGNTYGPAMRYANDPLLYAFHVGRKWATDIAYVQGIAKWMTALWPDYADTLPGGRYQSIPVHVGAVEVPCNARLELGRTRMDLRPVVEALGATVEWVAPEQGGPRVNVTKACCKGCE